MLLLWSMSLETGLGFHHFTGVAFVVLFLGPELVFAGLNRAAGVLLIKHFDPVDCCPPFWGFYYRYWSCTGWFWRSEAESRNFSSLSWLTVFGGMLVISQVILSGVICSGFSGSGNLDQ